MIRIFSILGLLGPGLVVGLHFSLGGEPSKPDRGNSFWAYEIPRKGSLPLVKNLTWVANPIDAFVLAKLENLGLSPSTRADKSTLLRRVTFDLTGLPPTLEEQEAFLGDTSPRAYEKVVERLLASPHFGERWAQHWLDLVRYAETDGFKADDYRPGAHQYRDYVIRAFNAGLPYDRFIQQQLAGDELEPENPEALTATGLNRLYPDEFNAANLEQRWQEILDDVTDVAAQAFLGLTMGCARCHNHKFDPISQVEYFRFQAFFAPMFPRDLIPVMDVPRQQYMEQLAAWENATREIRKEMESLTAGQREELRRHALEKFRKEIQEAVLTPESRRTPYQKQIAAMAEKQMTLAEKDVQKKLPQDQKNRCRVLEQALEKVEPKRPPGPVSGLGIKDLGREAPPTFLLANGDWRKPRKEVQPGFPATLGDTPPDTKIDPTIISTGRRAALARWLTQKEHPLTARVMVNRLWHHHFGRGIVATPNDFGVQGEPPTHPELLDWLAVEFMEHGWSLKHMHRLMVTSATYCQSSFLNTDGKEMKAFTVDRENKFLWHARRQRLEGEALRDAMLSVSGEINLRPYGPSAKPKLPEKISSYAWKPDSKVEDQCRRSIYVFAKRNMRYPLFDAFDLPDMHNSCAARSKTTTAPQALLMLNGDFTLERAQNWAVRLLDQFGRNDSASVAQAFQSTWGRPPTKQEKDEALQFIYNQTGHLPSNHRKAALVDFCHALFNANEFLYVD